MLYYVYAFVCVCLYVHEDISLRSLACIEYFNSEFKVAELDFSQLTFQDIHCCLLIWYEIRIFRQNVIFVSHNVWHYLKSLFSSSANFNVNALMLNKWQSVDSERVARNLTFSWKLESLRIGDVWFSCVYVSARALALEFFLCVCVDTHNHMWARRIEFNKVPRASNSYLEGSPSKLQITSCTYCTSSSP